MNRDLALTEGGDSWPMERYVPGAGGHPPGDGHVSTLDLATLIRIAKEWRWLILGALAVGLALALVYTLLSTPLYRSWVTLEVNPPSVQVTTGESSESASPAPRTLELVATQVGLLRSRSLAVRVAEDLSLANKPGFVEESDDPLKRLKSATDKVQQELVVVPPEQGTLIRINYVSPSPQVAAQVANGVADAFI
ncbi:MAG: hypothetical protein H0U83_06325, partial [Sphingomonas sp.]|nr:hypothetical protein [Sphingomonas sp.]